MNTLMDTADPGSWEAVVAAQKDGYSGVDEGGVLATFYDRHILQKHESELAGTSIYKPRLYIKLRLPADPKNAPDRPATEEDKVRFRSAWQRYQDRQKEGEIGTPLSEMVWITPAQLAMCRAQGVVAVEQLAACSDAALSKIGMGSVALRAKAQEALAGDEPALRDLRKENHDLKQNLGAMQRRMEALEKAKVPEAAPIPIPELSDSDGGDAASEPTTADKRRAALEKARAAKRAKSDAARTE